MSLAGKLLVASPHLLDPNFYRTVVLIFLHDDEDGALGLVLNRETPESIADYLPAWADHISPPGLVHYGGPVDPEIAIGLGRSGAGGEVGVVGLSMVDLTGDPTQDSPAVKVYSGYSGWSPGQLEEEVASGVWFVLEAAPDDPFATPNSLWQRVMRRQPGLLSVLSTYPEDPALN